MNFEKNKKIVYLPELIRNNKEIKIKRLAAENVKKMFNSIKNSKGELLYPPELFEVVQLTLLPNNILFEKMKTLQTFVEINKLNSNQKSLNEKVGFDMTHEVMMNLETQKTLSRYSPVIAELHNNNLVIIDGVHRAYSSWKNKKPLTLIMIFPKKDDINYKPYDDLPGDFKSLSEINIVDKKPPKNKRMWIENRMGGAKKDNYRMFKENLKIDA